jgi:membrane associated rhomboid family serine protease
MNTDPGGVAAVGSDEAEDVTDVRAFAIGCVVVMIATAPFLYGYALFNPMAPQPWYIALATAGYLLAGAAGGVFGLCAAALRQVGDSAALEPLHRERTP